MSQILRMGMAGLGVASTQVLPSVSAHPYIKEVTYLRLRQPTLRSTVSPLDLLKLKT